MNRRGQPIYYTNDVNGRLIAKLYPSGKLITYGYDLHGNLTNATTLDPAQQSTNVIRLAYDGKDQMTNILYPKGRWLSFSYYDSGQRASMLDQLGHRTDYHYDSSGRLQSLSDESSTEIIRYFYDAAGRLAGKKTANGNYSTNIFDDAGQLLRLVNYKNDGSINSRFDYSYDSRARRKTMQTLDGGWTYGYDDLGQLTNAVFASSNLSVGSQNLTYVYDALGNRLTTFSNGVVTVYVPNGLNQYQRVGNTTNSYDADGNLRAEFSQAGTTSYTFDEENRLTTVVSSEGILQYEYDAFGNRTAIIKNGQKKEFVTDPIGFGNVVAEFDSNDSATLHYTYGNGLVCRTDNTLGQGFYEFDAIGSTASITGTNGGTLNQYRYLPFGETFGVSETSHDDFQFVGQWGVTTEMPSLVYMRARFYAKETGSFCSEDPAGLSGGNVNLHNYCSANPTTFTDPSGMAYRAQGPLGGSAYAPLLGINHEHIVFDQSHSIPSGMIVYDEHGNRYTGQINNIGINGNGQWFTYTGAVMDLYRRRPGNVNDATVLQIVQNIQVKPYAWEASIPGIGCLFQLYYDDCQTVAEDVYLTAEITEIANKNTAVATSQDPNAKICPAGFGTNGFVRASALMPYTFQFENATNASAPAQQVDINDPLSANLDWTTFELTEVGFGDQVITIPAHSQYFETTVPMTYNGVNFEVDVYAGIDLATGKVYANFYSIDPLTSLPPDVTVGFLPPEDGSGRGQGHVSFTIHPKTNLVTGTIIRNVAYISFDNQTIISTDQINPEDPAQGFDLSKGINTIDADAPASFVAALPYVSTNTSFNVNWSGTDLGSGIVSYDLFVSTNGITWKALLSGTTNTALAFQGAMGNRYAFYSIAHDGVGNVENAPSTADTAIIIAPHFAPQFVPLDPTNQSQFIAVGQQVWFTNTAASPDKPITYSLGAGAPAGASINWTNGVFSWTPSCDQASTTNVIMIWATDSYGIPLSNVVSVVISVSECLQLNVGSTGLQVGQTSSVPVSIISTRNLTNLSFTVVYPTNRFTNWVITPTHSAIGATRVQSIDSSKTFFNLAANNGQAFHGPAVLGWLTFKALPDHSAFVPVTPASVIGLKTDGGAVGNSSGQPGRVVVIGPEPLLEAWMSNSTRMMTLYGNPGSSYLTLFNTNLLKTNWYNGWRVPMTNLAEYYAVNQTAPQIYYRALEFSADPPILELNAATSSNLNLLLYGRSGTNYVVQATTNLVGNAVWTSSSAFMLTNSFRFFAVTNQPTGEMMFRMKRP